MDEEEIAISRVLNDAGCRVRYMANSPSELRFCPYPFNHAKYAVIDNRSLIIHSANWDTRGVPQDPTFGNREWGVVIKNEMIAEYFSDIFLTDFNPFRTFSVAFEEFSFNSGEAGNSNGLKFESTSWNGEYDPKFFAKEINGHFSVTPLISPDNSLGTMSELIESAEESIAIEQLYFYERLGSKTNPLIERIIDANERGVEIRVLLNFNPDYSREGVDTNERNMETVELLKECGIEARLLYTNSTPFSNLHNKGMIVDSEKVLISSINLNANGLLKNREVGVIIENEEVANYFEDVFDYDWNVASEKEGSSLVVRAVSIGIVFLLAGCLVYRSWSKK
jgi:phosphatidylserine/phosphatidylglycerophosphate/cardiolipin synthase-like enzyme